MNIVKEANYVQTLDGFTSLSTLLNRSPPDVTHAFIAIIAKPSHPYNHIAMSPALMGTSRQTVSPIDCVCDLAGIWPIFCQQ